MNASHRMYFAALVVLAVFASPSVAQTALSSAVTYQGQLNGPGGPVNASLPMAFALWNALSDGTQVGPTLTFDGGGGNPPPVVVTDGLFNVVLDFGAVSYNGDARWLEISVDGTTLAPRQELTAAPYSVQTRGIFVNETGDRVGIGTDAPTHALHVVSADRTSAVVESPNIAGTWLNLLNTSVGGRFWHLISTGEDNGEGAGNLLIGHGTSAGVTGTVMTLLNSGRVGIGTTAPKQRLHNVGDYYGRGHFWLHAFEGDGQDGTAYVQARDDSGTSNIGLHLRTQKAGTLYDAVNIAPSGSVQIGGGLTLTNSLGALDQSQESADSGANLTTVWQSFTAGQFGGRLETVEYLAHTNDPVGSRGAQLIVYTGTGTSGTVLATQSFILPTSGFASITLVNPPFLTAGQVYTLYFMKTAPGIDHTFSFSSQNPYPGGTSSFPGSDLVFRTYYQGETLRLASGAIRFADSSYQTTAVRVVRATATVDFGPFGAGTAVGSIGVTAAEIGGSVSISPDQDLPNGLVLAWARVSAAGIVRFGVRNVTTSVIDPPPITFYTTVIDP